MTANARTFVLRPREVNEPFEAWVERMFEDLTRVSQEEGTLSPVNIDLDTITDGDYLTFDATNQYWTNGNAIPSNLEPSDGDKGDITVSSGTWTIDSGVVTNAKLATVSTATIKGRTTAGTGAPEDLTGTQATALLDAVVGDSGSGGTKGLVPAPASGDAAANKFLKADGTWATGAGSWSQVGSASTTTGSSSTITGISSSATEIVIIFNGVSPDTACNLIIELGDSGGIETTGYTPANTIGLSATSTVYGTLTGITRDNLTWWFGDSVYLSSTTPHWGSIFTKATSATTDRIQISVDNSAVFDAGSWEVWERT